MRRHPVRLRETARYSLLLLRAGAEAAALSGRSFPVALEWTALVAGLVLDLSERSGGPASSATTCEPDEDR